MRVYEPLSSSTKIHKPSMKSEFEIQATLYNRLKEDGFIVAGNMTVFRTKGVAFDLVVFDKTGSARAIIETKREDEGSRVALDQTTQGFKYRHFGVPVILFWDMTLYDDLKQFLQSKDDAILESDVDELRIKESPKVLGLARLRDLRRRLDVAAMAAYDAKMCFSNSIDIKNMEINLENFRDKVDELYRSL